ncbi:MAG TPA: hypothetical protein VKG22_02195 [Stellaceae bacterium]|nr:hypothetical protein [Stellaceae bacterium]
MNSRANLRGPATFACALTLLFLVAGCGRTLVFGERDGFNFAIRADSASQPPLEVNFGLDRTVGTIIPPAAQVDGRPAGEGVNMFAGFQIDRDDTGTPTLFGVKIRVGTQFASGEAAKKVAGDPEVVKQIVSVTDRPIARPIPTSIGPEVDACSIALSHLQPPQKRELARKLGLFRPSEGVPDDVAVNTRLRERFSQASESPEGLAEFKQAFDCGTGR